MGLDVSDLLGDWIIRAGAIVTGLVLLLQAAYRYVVKPAYDASVGDKIDCIAEKLAAYAEDQAAQIAKVNEQLTPNHGTSLRDQTNRIEDTLKRHIAAERERHRAIAAELKTTNARVDDLLRRGHTERVHISEQIVEHDPVTSPPLDSED